MNHKPRLETIFRKLHIPDFMYLSPQPTAERARRVRRQEQSSAVTKASGQLATAQTIEFNHRPDTRLIIPSPEQANSVPFEPEPTSPEE